MLFVRLEAARKLIDGLRLIAARLVVAHQFKVHVPGSCDAPARSRGIDHYNPTRSSLSPGALVKSGQSYAHTGPYCEFWRYQLLLQCEHRIAVWLRLCDSTFSSVFSRASGATTKVV